MWPGGGSTEAAGPPTGVDASRFDREIWREGLPPDSGFLGRQARRIATGEGSGFERLYRTFVAARALLGLALLLTGLLATEFAGADPRILGLCLAHALLACAVWLLPARWTGPMLDRGVRLRHRAWLATLGVDLLLFGALHAIAGASLNSAALLVLPALMAGVLTPRRQALAVAAIASLLLLVEAALGGGAEPLLALSRAGLAGGGLFLVTLLVHEMAGRLAREERTARSGLELARQQAELNRMVIEELEVGVLVLDPRGRLRSANPVARRLLPDLPELHGSATELPPRLARALDAAQSADPWPEAGLDLLPAEGEPGPALRLRLRPSRSGHQLLWIEDLRQVQARLRDEGLAAMGRVTAGIAHEIRNPLAAITQANALLAEDPPAGQRVRLIGMIADHAARLRRIVDDVMEVAVVPPTAPPPLDARAACAAIAQDWLQQQRLPAAPEGPLWLSLPEGPLWLRFEAEHLRRVLINLLDNALRHSRHEAGSLQLQLRVVDAGWAELSLASDGPPIAPEVQAHLFEPFHSTRSRGTGLGLYICRELCGRYGARIDYQGRPATERHPKVFRLLLRRLPQGLPAVPDRPEPRP